MGDELRGQQREVVIDRARGEKVSSTSPPHTCFCTANKWNPGNWGEESIGDCRQRIKSCVFIVLRLGTE